MNVRRFEIILIMTALAILALIACAPLTAYPTYTPSVPLILVPLFDTNQQSALAAAQATLAAGQNQISDLAYQATLVRLSIDQAAKAVAQTTLDYNQRRLMELAIQGTEISQNMAQAVATQQFISAQTQMVWDATATAQSQAATATYAAYAFNATQAAQAQAVRDFQSAYIAQENATQAAFALTATPWAAIQADIARTQEDSEHRSWWDNFILTPLIVILTTLVVVLLIMGGVLTYWRLMPVLEMRLRTIERANTSPLLLVDAVIVDTTPGEPGFLQKEVSVHNAPPAPGGEPFVEIVGPDEPSVINWITDAEQQLRAEGRV